MKKFTAKILIGGVYVDAPIAAKSLAQAQDIARDLQFEINYAADNRSQTLNYTPETVEVTADK